MRWMGREKKVDVGGLEALWRWSVNDVFAVAEIPRTLTGKKMDLLVKKLLLGMKVDKVAYPDAMSDPGSVDYSVEFARQRTESSA